VEHPIYIIEQKATFLQKVTKIAVVMGRLNCIDYFLFSEVLNSKTIYNPNYTMLLKTFSM